jgi:hypothetical protein
VRDIGFSEKVERYTGPDTTSQNKKKANCIKSDIPSGLKK